MNSTTFQRLAQVTGIGARQLDVLKDSPEQAVLNLERWVGATSNPALALDQALAAGTGLDLLLRLLASSQPFADTLIQNPELASLVLDPAERREFPVAERVLREGNTLLAAATSPSHALDRIRFLKQRWTVPIVANDVAQSWDPPEVWRAISSLADAVIELTAKTVWSRFAEEKGIKLPCPLAIIAFGKLGGEELNYSSDIDLVFVARDTLPNELKVNLARFAEALSRALSERSGRGCLYRVDLRLRPYGSSGPLVPTMDAVESYYALYAEPWEVQALLRSRVVLSPTPITDPGGNFRDRWAAMVDRICFRPTLGEPALEAMLAMRSRIEEYSSADDLKRGKGGIRDVEFLVQILQLLHGFEDKSVRIRPTLEALARLAGKGHLPQESAQALSESYVFLRQLEHRCQLLSDQQTHLLPSNENALRSIAALMNFGSSDELMLALQHHRFDVSAIYERFLGGPGASASPRERLMPVLTRELVDWLDALPESESYYSALIENESSLYRLEHLISSAPAILSRLKSSLSVLELVISGEIEETDPHFIGTIRPSGTENLESQAPAYVAAATRLAVAWSFADRANQNPNLETLIPKGSAQVFDLGNAFSDLVEQILLDGAKSVAPQLDIIALGSFARRELTIESDADVIFLIKGQADHAEAEDAAQALLRLTGRLHRQGVPISLDLRLRPDGGKGLLVRTYDAIRTYEKDGMELWERFALGQSRLLAGALEAKAVIDTAAYALPLTEERLTELLGMKQRIEVERVKPQHRWRHIKLGFGGLGDLEWFVHLHEMRFPPALMDNQRTNINSVGLRKRIQMLNRNSLINATEALELESGRDHLMRLRHWMTLQGLTGDVMPENPDKLDRLAKAFGCSDGNALLLRHQAVTTRVREIYEEGLSRLTRTSS